ncbi:MAG: T9SS type A sorting domain-containing protein [Fibrobacterales bacterium]
MKKILIFILGLLITQAVYSQAYFNNFLIIDNPLLPDSVTATPSAYRADTLRLLIQLGGTQGWLEWKADYDSSSTSITASLYSFPDSSVVIPLTIEKVDSCQISYQCVYVKGFIPDNVPLNEYRIETTSPSSTPTIITQSFFLFDKATALWNYTNNELTLWFSEALASMMQDSLTFTFSREGFPNDSLIIHSWVGNPSSGFDSTIIDLSTYGPTMPDYMHHGSNLQLRYLETDFIMQSSGESLQPAIVPVQVVGSPYFISKAEINPDDSLLILYFHEKIDPAYIDNTHTITVTNNSSVFSFYTVLDRLLYIGDSTMAVLQLPPLTPGLDSTAWRLEVNPNTFVNLMNTDPNATIVATDNFIIHQTAPASPTLDSAVLSNYTSNLSLFWSDPVIYDSMPGLNIIALDPSGVYQSHVDISSHYIYTTTGDSTAIWWDGILTDTLFNWLARDWQLSIHIGYGQYRDSVSGDLVTLQNIPLTIRDDYVQMMIVDPKYSLDTNSHYFFDIALMHTVHDPSHYIVTGVSGNESAISNGNLTFHWTGTHWLMEFYTGPNMDTVSINITIQSPIDGSSTTYSFSPSLGDYPQAPFTPKAVQIMVDSITQKEYLSIEMLHHVSLGNPNTFSLKVYNDPFLNSLYTEFSFDSLNNQFLNDSAAILRLSVTPTQKSMIESWIAAGKYLVFRTYSGFAQSLITGQQLPETLFDVKLWEQYPPPFEIIGPTFIQIPYTQTGDSIAYFAYDEYYQTDIEVYATSTNPTLISPIDSSLSPGPLYYFPYTLSGAIGQCSLQIDAYNMSYEYMDTMTSFVDIYNPGNSAHYALLAPSTATVTTHSTTTLIATVTSKYTIEGMTVTANVSSGLIAPENISVTKATYNTWSVAVSSNGLTGSESITLNLIHETFGLMHSTTIFLQIYLPTVTLSIGAYSDSVNYENITTIGITTAVGFPLAIDWGLTTGLSPSSLILNNMGGGVWSLNVTPTLEEWGPVHIAIDATDGYGGILSTTVLNFYVKPPLHTFIVEDFAPIIGQNEMRTIRVSIHPDLTLTVESGEINVITNSGLRWVNMGNGQWVIYVTPDEGQWGFADLLIQTYDINNTNVGSHQVAIEVANEDDSYFEPCNAFCLQRAVFEHNLFNSSILFEFNEQIEFVQSGAIHLIAYRYESSDDPAPELLQEMAFDVDSQTQLNSNSIQFALTASEATLIKKMYLQSNVFLAEINAPLFRGLSTNTVNTNRAAPVDLEQGATLQLYAAQYEPFEHKLQLTFDGNLDPSSLIPGSLIKIKEHGLDISDRESVDILLQKFFFGDEDCGDCNENVQQLTVFINEQEHQSLQSFQYKNNLIIHLDNGLLRGTNNQFLQESTFEYTIPLTYGVSYGSNWVTAATFDIEEKLLKLTLSTGLSSYQSVQIDLDFTTTSLFLIFGVRDSMLTSDGPPLDMQSNTMYLRTNEDDFTFYPSDSTLFIQLNTDHSDEAEYWRTYYNAVLENEMVIYLHHGVLTNTENVINPDLTFTVDLGKVTLPDDSTYIPPDDSLSPPATDSTFDLSAPEVDLKKFDGVTYFIMGDLWKVNTSTSSFSFNAYTAQYEEYTTGDRVYLEADTYYNVVRNSGTLYSATTTIPGSAYASLDLSIKSTGTAYRIQFLSSSVKDVENARFAYIVVNLKTAIADTVLDFHKSSIDKFGLSGDSFRVSAFITSLIDADSTFIQSFSITNDISLTAPRTIIVPAQTWQMVSFGSRPYQTSQLDNTVSLFWWYDAAFRDLLYDRYLSKENIDEVLPGQSAWIKSDSTLTLSLAFDTSLVSVDITKGDDGWNQVSNPYGFNLDTEAFGSREFFKWNGSNYNLVNYLIPGEGYWTTVSRDEAIDIERVVAWDDTEHITSNTLFKHATPTKGDWDITINLKALNTDLHDAYNAIGIKPYATNDIDAFDKRELPTALGDAVYLSFVQNNLLFRTDYKSKIEEYATWNITVGTTIKDPLRALFTLNNLKDIQQLGYTFHLVEGGSHTLLENPDTEIILNGTKNYTLIVSENDYAITHLLKGPSVYNFPNPFKTHTTIQLLQIPRTGSTITLKVYTANGNLIFEDTYPFAESIRWEPVDAKGTPLKSGIYIYQITTGSTVVRNTMHIAD